jgi:diguanylate cyclase (GGDEF)-like protein
VLRQVAWLLRDNTRTSDIVARYGGEEFVAVFLQTDLDQAAAMCERIRNAVESFAWSAIHPDLSVTLSLGLDADLGRGSIERMLEIADMRLYAAKQSGRNRVVIETPA